MPDNFHWNVYHINLKKKMCIVPTVQALICHGRTDMAFTQGVPFYIVKAFSLHNVLMVLSTFSITFQVINVFSSLRRKGCMSTTRLSNITIEIRKNPFFPSPVFTIHVSNIISYVRFEVLRAVDMKSSVFWDITPCSPLFVNCLPLSFTLVSCDMFLRNVGWLSTDYTALYPRRWSSSLYPCYLHSTKWEDFIILLVTVAVYITASERVS
jgi:hypothetical protein